jgi:hypothetical protein
MKTSSIISNQCETLALTIQACLNLGYEGQTLHLDSKLVFNDQGYYISHKSPSLILSIDKVKNMKRSDLAELLKNLYFKASSFDYIGYWIDKGTVYIDLSFHVLNRSQAIFEGIKNDQKAIWDCKNESTIFLENYTY